MGSTNERRLYIVTSSPIGSAETQNGPSIMTNILQDNLLLKKN